MQYRKLLIVFFLFNIFCSVSSQTFVSLRLGEVKPEGWIKNQMVRDISSGYISVYDSLQPSLKLNVFGFKKAKNYSIDKDGNWETRRETWWPGEHEGFFADLVTRNAFLTDYQPWIKKSGQLIDNVLKAQDPSGYIGIYDEECRLDNILNENGELWTQSRMINAILAYYEFTGNVKYLKAAKRAVDYTIERYEKSGKTYFQQPKPNGGGLTHGLTFVETLEWLHKITGDKKYVRFGLWLYTDYSKAEAKLTNIDCQLGCLLDNNRLFKEHSVHIVEHFRVIFWLYQETNDPELKKAYENIIHKYNLSQAITGGLVTDPVIQESVARNYANPALPVEYCSITEGAVSFCSALQKFGVPSYGDLIENLVFNAGQSARLPNGKAISYITADNRLVAKESKGFRYQVAACHSVACCNLNAGKLMPYYVSNMWMKTADNKTLVAALLGPSSLTTTLNKKTVRIREETLYPFENSIRFTISPSGKMKFNLMVRLPEWAKAYKVSATGANVTELNGFIIVSKMWEREDVVTIEFEDPVLIRRHISNSIYLQKGALKYAMKIDEKMVPTRQLNYGYANFDVLPADSAAANLIFKTLKVPDNTEANFERYNKLYVYKLNPEANKEYPFDTPYGFITGRFIDKGNNVEKSLIPVGSTVLRKVGFLESKWEK